MVRVLAHRTMTPPTDLVELMTLLARVRTAGGTGIAGQTLRFRRRGCPPGPAVSFAPPVKACLSAETTFMLGSVEPPQTRWRPRRRSRKEFVAPSLLLDVQRGPKHSTYPMSMRQYTFTAEPSGDDYRLLLA